MQKLDPNDLTVETFAVIGDDGSSVSFTVAGGVTDGVECGKTVNTCYPQCQTYKAGNCV